MTGTKLTCPDCEMTLVTPTPMAPNTLVTCPRCGTCFGVPTLETKAPRAEPVKAPPVLPARPIAPAPPVPRVPAVAAPVPMSETVAPPPKVRPARPRPAVAPVSEALNFEEPAFPISDESRAAEKTEPKDRAKEFKHRRRKKSDPLVMWLMVGSGAVLLVASVLVGIMLLSPDKKSSPKVPPKEPMAPANAGDNKKPVINEAAGKPEKRSAAAARASNSPKGKAGGADKKDKADGKMDGEKDLDAPIPIPGLGPSRSEKPATKPEEAPPPSP